MIIIEMAKLMDMVTVVIPAAGTLEMTIFTTMPDLDVATESCNHYIMSPNQEM